MKKRNLVVMLAALTSAAVAAPAAAQSGASAGPWYLGFGLGKSHSTGGNGSGVVSGVPFTVSGLEGNQTSFQVNGGYQFTPEWGIELQYTDLGKRDGSVAFGAPVNGTATISGLKAYQVGLAGTGTLWFNESWFGRAKLGVSSNHISSNTATVTTAGGTGSVSVSSGSKTSVLAGIGAGYKWTPNISTRLEYEYFGKFASTPTGDIKGSNLGLRFQYSF
jgi:OOP family OmpA-OmpF porin